MDGSLVPHVTKKMVEGGSFAPQVTYVCVCFFFCSLLFPKTLPLIRSENSSVIVYKRKY